MNNFSGSEKISNLNRPWPIFYKDYNKDKEWLTRIISEGTYEEIAKEIPPELEEAVDALLLKGIDVDRAPFEAEISRD